VPETFATDEERIFNYRLSYKKGAAIMHMIRGEVQNDSLFFSILRDYLNRYRNSVATGEDFQHLLEEKTGRNFDTFFEQWYYGEGYPSITVNWKHDTDTLYMYAFLTSSTSITPQFNILTGYKISLNDRDTIFYRRHQANYDEWKINISGNIKSIEVDPENWLLLTVDSVNSISKGNLEKRFYLAPNPAKNKISVYFADMMKESKIYVIDSFGKIIFEDRTDAFPYDINLNGYKPGLYFVLVKDREYIYTDKFIQHSH
jgi:hypothetical protein